MAVPRVSAINTKADSTIPAPTTQSTAPIAVLGPPPTEGMMDANHGSIFETVGYSGILLMMLGTVVVYMSKKQATAYYNTAESEMYAATDMGKLLKWI